MTKLNNNLREKIFDLLRAGKTQQEVAKEIGVTRLTISRFIHSPDYINRHLELSILELAKSGISKKNIAKDLMIGLDVASSVFEKYRVPEVKILKLNNLVSTRLLYFCNDIKTISKRLAVEILYQKPEKIIVSNRLQKIIEK